MHNAARFLNYSTQIFIFLREKAFADAVLAIHETRFGVEEKFNRESLAAKAMSEPPLLPYP
jgi:hypothetical protein